MGDKRVFDYLDGLNKLYKETGLLIGADSTPLLFEVNEPDGRNKVVAEVYWNNRKKVYECRMVR